METRGRERERELWERETRTKMPHCVPVERSLYLCASLLQHSSDHTRSIMSTQTNYCSKTWHPAIFSSLHVALLFSLLLTCRVPARLQLAGQAAATREAEARLRQALSRWEGEKIDRLKYRKEYMAKCNEAQVLFRKVSLLAAFLCAGPQTRKKTIPRSSSTERALSKNAYDT